MENSLILFLRDSVSLVLSFVTDARTLKTVMDTKLEDSTNSKDDQTAIQEELDYSSTED